MAQGLRRKVTRVRIIRDRRRRFSKQLERIAELAGEYHSQLAGWVKTYDPETRQQALDLRKKVRRLLKKLSRSNHTRELASAMQRLNIPRSWLRSGPIRSSRRA